MSIPHDILALTGNFKNNMKRFPLAIAFNILLCAVIIIAIWEDLFWENKLINVSIYYLSVGYLLSLFLKLWAEEVTNKKIATCIKIALHTILILDAIYLYVTTSSSWFEISLARAAAISTLLSIMFILPFFREKDDIASWNMTVISIANAGIAFLISHLMCVGISLLITSLNTLFELALDGEWYFTIWILCSIGLSSILFLGLLPYGEKKANRTPIVLGFFSKIIRFLFLPLLGTYLTVLYVYTIKILIQWELPEGWVSILTTALMMGYITIVFWLYPSAQQEKNTLDRQIIRWLPILILPLLILMSVGIIRRFNDYGITINRLYILALNIWFYIVCIGTIINRNKRIHWIPISFSILFVVTSLFPVNFASITRNMLLKKTQKEINATYTGKLPMNNTLYIAWLKTYPQEKAIQINDRIKYLNYTFDQECLSHLVEDINYYNVEFQLGTLDNIINMISESQYLSSKITIDLSEGYSSITSYKSEKIVLEKEQEHFVISLQPSTNETIEIDIRTSDIYRWGKLAPKEWEPQELPCSSSNYKFILTDFSYSSNYPKGLIFKYSGYLLKKQL